MARQSSSARRYAEAAFEIAQRDHAVGAWLEQLDRAAAAVADEEVARRLANPQVPFDARRRALLEIVADEPLPPVANLVSLLLRRRRIDLLPSLAREFRRIYNRSQGIVEATVTSAAELDDAEMKQVSARLEQLAGARVQIEQRVDPALLGGVQVRLGDKLIDGSVRGRLERLRATLAARA
jgi:F-type H+-transporting ATPase subunit delta